jgi:NAD-dependent deacetylase
MVREMTKVIDQAEPNSAHTGMAELERMGRLHHIITQNVDNLHQAAGSKNVIEYHGNISTLTCLRCGKKFKCSDLNNEFPPRCICWAKQILKPDVIFFGEAIPYEEMNKSFQLASQAQVLIVAGTSAAVSPANTIPATAKQNGAKIIEINKEKNHLTGTITDIFLQGDAGRIMNGIVDAVKIQAA